MTSRSTWLSKDEELLWRSWMQLSSEVSTTLQRDMQATGGLSMSDYEVLVHLTDDPDGRLRVSDLARILQWGLSRVSHHVTRMERRGLVSRSECREDGRGAFVEVTLEGRQAIELAAPGHVATVRRLVFDVLDDEEVRRMTDLVDKLLRAREGADEGVLATGSTRGSAEQA